MPAIKVILCKLYKKKRGFQQQHLRFDSLSEDGIGILSMSCESVSHSYKASEEFFKSRRNIVLLEKYAYTVPLQFKFSAIFDELHLHVYVSSISVVSLVYSSSSLNIPGNE